MRLAEKGLFELQSFQFSLQYAFVRADILDMLFRSIADLLVPGGIIIATVPCFAAISKLLGDRSKVLKRGGSGNSLLRINADRAPTSVERGWRYLFSLGDVFKEMPEYTLPLETISR